jgi:hypothetical protein
MTVIMTVIITRDRHRHRDRDHDCDRDGLWCRFIAVDG